VVERLQRNRVVREALVFLAFCAFTALLTWPYVLHLRDAVADPGDGVVRIRSAKKETTAVSSLDVRDSSVMLKAKES
jgi:hypothetical protein